MKSSIPFCRPIQGCHPSSAVCHPSSPRCPTIDDLPAIPPGGNKDRAEGGSPFCEGSPRVGEPQDHYHPSDRSDPSEKREKHTMKTDKKGGFVLTAADFIAGDWPELIYDDLSENKQAVAHEAIRELKRHMAEVLDRKGTESFSSSHEVLGVVEDELSELVAAIQKKQPLNDVRHELLDLAETCIFAVACIDANTMDW
jgi:hypothetical protein